jgi:hypothetical protein
MRFHDIAMESVSKGVMSSKIATLPVIPELAKLRMSIENERIAEIDNFVEKAQRELKELEEAK